MEIDSWMGGIEGVVESTAGYGREEKNPATGGEHRFFDGVLRFFYMEIYEI